MLEFLGYSAEIFLNCEKGIERFISCPNDFDLIITDYEMPGINGKQLVEKLKEIRPDIPIILMTGYAGVITEDLAMSWGMDSLLRKPFKLNELNETITQSLKTNKAS